MAKEFRVRMRWGSDHSDYQEPQEYEFDTLAELNAFLLGVSEAWGWMDYEQIDPSPDGTWPPICPLCGSSDINESDNGVDTGWQCYSCRETFAEPKMVS
jgi:hypothetical protein